MASPVVAKVKGHWPTARALRRDTDLRSLSAQAHPKSVGIEALIGDSAATAQARQERLDRVKIVALALRQAERHGSPPSLNDRCKLRIDSTLCATNRLGRLATAGVRTVLMQLDVRAIYMPQLACGSCSDNCKHPGEEPLSTPATKPRVDRVPRAKLLWQVAPRDTRSQDIEYRGEHKPIILRRPPAQRPPAGFVTRAVNFFSLRHNGSGSWLRSIRGCLVKCTLRDTRPGQIPLSATLLAIRCTLPMPPRRLAGYARLPRAARGSASGPNAGPFTPGFPKGGGSPAPRAPQRRELT